MSALDPFSLMHHELNTMDPTGDKRRFLPDTFQRASTFARFPFSLPSSQHLLVTGHAQTHEKVFELHLATTNVPYMMRLTDLEHQLFEIISIHKLMYHYSELENPTDRERRSLSVLGCMLQHRLTLLLLDVHFEEIEKILRLGLINGIDQDLWFSHFLGAASCARTIATFLEIDECRLYLPTVFEDLILGVDLIVLNEKQDNWCISIKSGRSGDPLIIEPVLARPHEEEPAFRAANRRRIFDGTEDMQRKFDGDFLAARIEVGKTNERFYDLSVYEDDVNHLRSFLETDRREMIVRARNTDSFQHTQNENVA